MRAGFVVIVICALAGVAAAQVIDERVEVTITSEPSGAMVYVDDVLAGTTPWTGKVEKGNHAVLVVREGHAPLEEVVTFTSRQRRFDAVLTVLAPAPAPPAGQGIVHVDASVAYATVSIDGVAQAGSPPLELVLAPGRYRVRVDKPGHDPWEDTVEVVAGKRGSVMATVVGKGRLVVSSKSVTPPGRDAAKFPAGDRPGAAVSVDGVPVGTTPVTTGALTAGFHTVEVTSPGAPAWSAVVLVEAGRDLPVVATFPAARVETFDDFSSNDHLSEDRPDVDFGIDSAATARRGVDRFTRGLSPYSGEALRKRAYAGTASLGYPEGLELRVTIGRGKGGKRGWDFGPALRTDLFGHEVLGHVRWQVWRISRFGLAVTAEVGGGAGGGGQRYTSARFGLASSWRFSNGMVLTTRLHADLWSDRLCDGPETAPGCAMDTPRNRELLGAPSTDPYSLAIDRRSTGAQVFASAVFEIPLRSSTSLALWIGDSSSTRERGRRTAAFNRQLDGERDPRWTAGVALVGRVRIFD